jgi:hypothetical protein
LASWRRERAGDTARAFAFGALVAAVLVTYAAVTLLPSPIVRVVVTTHGGLVTLLAFWRLSLVRLRVDARTLTLTAQLTAALGYAIALILALRETPEAAGYLGTLFAVLTFVNVMLCPFASGVLLASAAVHLALGALACLSAQESAALPWLLVHASNVVVATGFGYARLYRLRREGLAALKGQRLAQQNACLVRAASDQERKVAACLASPPGPTRMALEAASLRLEVRSAPESRGAREWAVARPLGGGAIAALLVHVSATGLAGALATHAVRALWDAYGEDDDFDGGAFLLAANRVLLKQAEQDARHAAAAVVVLSAGEARFCSAGFGPLLLVTERGEERDVRSFIGRGRLLGLGPDLVVSPQVVVLPTAARFSLLIGTESAVPAGARASDRKVCALLRRLEQHGAEALSETSQRDKAVGVVRRAA